MKQTFVFDPWKLSETVINLEELHRTITGRIYILWQERDILSETVINWEELHIAITGIIYSQLERVMLSETVINWEELHIAIKVEYILKQERDIFYKMFFDTVGKMDVKRTFHSLIFFTQLFLLFWVKSHSAIKTSKKVYLNVDDLPGK